MNNYGYYGNGKLSWKKILKTREVWIIERYGILKGFW